MEAGLQSIVSRKSASVKDQSSRNSSQFSRLLDDESVQTEPFSLFRFASLTAMHEHADEKLPQKREAIIARKI